MARTSKYGTTLVLIGLVLAVAIAVWAVGTLLLADRASTQRELPNHSGPKRHGGTDW